MQTDGEYDCIASGVVDAKSREDVSMIRYHFDLAISRAALISGASVRRGSDSLKKEC